MFPTHYIARGWPSAPCRVGGIRDVIVELYEQWLAKPPANPTESEGRDRLDTKT